MKQTLNETLSTHIEELTFLLKESQKEVSHLKPVQTDQTDVKEIQKSIVKGDEVGIDTF